jgi:hypothetical protein
MLKKIVSGGQTGVDRAALDVAIVSGIDHGGWCPKGRRAEDGRIPERYNLQETPRAGYRQRTAWNVRDSDGTLILVRHRLRGGSRYTCDCAIQSGQRYFLARLDAMTSPQSAYQWIQEHSIAILNIAGPRATSDPLIYEDARYFLEALLSLERASA